MTTGMVQKSYTALFLQWSLRKSDISKMKKKIERVNVESIEKNLKIKIEKK